jgi:predicted permease
MPFAIADLKYAVRQFKKRPWFTLLTVMVLSGGLGVSVYTFAALNAMIYRDLPLPDGSSIVRIGIGDWVDFQPLEAFELVRIREQAESVAEVGVYRISGSLIGEAGASRSVRSVEADWRIFEFTRTPPLLGRVFVRDDNSSSAERVAVLSHDTWQAVFSGDRAVVGELVRIDGTPTRVVGVMPEGYAFPANIGMWLPLAQRDVEPVGYSGKMFDAYARLRPGVSVEAAEAEIATLLDSVRAERPESVGARKPRSVSILTFQEEQWGVLGTLLFSVLNLLSLSILLLAAVNVGNLLLVRTNERIKEIGVRLALGASRFRVTAQAVTENVILCALGGTIAIFLAARTLAATNGFMNTLLGSDLPFWWTWSLDRDVAVAAVIFLLLTIVVVSVLPVVAVSSADPISILRDSTRAGGGLATGRISRALVTVQVALISAVMLVGSAVAIVADRAANISWGMETENLYMMSVALPPERYATPEQQLAFAERMLAEVRATGRVDAAVVMQQIGTARFALAGREYAARNDQPGAWLVALSESPSPVGPPLVAGRGFDSRDSATGAKTVIINESLARAHWPNESAVGRSIDVSIGSEAAEGRTEGRTIVGVVGDVPYDPIGMTPIGDSALYFPLPQSPIANPQFVVRYLGTETQARSVLFEALARVDSTVAPAPAGVRSYEASLAQTTLFARTLTKVFAACGAFAILLAITGIYAMSRNDVLRRTHEIGLRRALGASNRNVVTKFVALGTRQLAVGLAISAVLCTVALFLIRRGVDVGAGTLVLIGFVVVAVVATAVLLSIYLSVRGVIRVEPSVALRDG